MPLTKLPNFRHGANHHLRIKATRAVSAARASGRLQPAEHCEDCGSKFGKPAWKKPYAHHEDYAKPLDVVWLCGKCHRTRHYGSRSHWTPVGISSEAHARLQEMANSQGVLLCDLATKLILAQFAEIQKEQAHAAH